MDYIWLLHCFEWQNRTDAALLGTYDRVGLHNKAPFIYSFPKYLRWMLIKCLSTIQKQAVKLDTVCYWMLILVLDTPKQGKSSKRSVAKDLSLIRPTEVSTQLSFWQSRPHCLDGFITLGRDGGSNISLCFHRLDGRYPSSAVNFYRKRSYSRATSKRNVLDEWVFSCQRTWKDNWTRSFNGVIHNRNLHQAKRSFHLMHFLSRLGRVFLWFS